VIHFGTSGFSYDDWVGIFYPKGMPRKEWLPYYSHEFDSLELNSTYYAIPRLDLIKSLVFRTGKSFKFAVKANQEMTHQRQDNGEVFTAFTSILQPFIDTEKLGCILAQFPYSFGCSDENLDYLEVFRERMGSLPVVIEFRNANWIKPETFNWLRRHNTGFCCVDEPRLPRLMPPLVEVTGDIGYIRFHGRNAAKWWHHEHAYERYDYTYSAEELEEWLPKIREVSNKAEMTFIFANNHWRGQSVDTIRQLRLMLD
jgi:uncharacterized protein YecE (DUF72 family)